MSMRYFTVIIFSFLLVCGAITSSYAQSSKLQQADKDFDSHAYIDAQQVYLKVVENGYKSAQVYKKLADTYYYNSKYAEAAKWYRNLIEDFEEEVDSESYFRAALSLRTMGELEVSAEYMRTYYEQIGKEIPDNFDFSDPQVMQQLYTASQEIDIDLVSTNSGIADFGPAFLGEEYIVFASGRDTSSEKHDWNEMPFLSLYQAKRDKEGGDLEEPLRLEGEIHSPFHEASAVFTADGKTVYFTRNNYKKGKAKYDDTHTMRLKIFKATLQEDHTWGEVEELPFNDDSYSVAYPALNPQENKLYFSADFEGTYGLSDLWYVEIDKEENSYGEPINLGDKINTIGRDAFPYIDSNNVLYFSTDGRPGFGGLDIFYTKLDSLGLPTEIKNIGAPVNSSQDDFAFIKDAVTGKGYFSSNRTDIENEAGVDNIYYFTEECHLFIEGMVYDEETSEPIAFATVEILDENGEFLDSRNTDQEGNYKFKVPCHHDFVIKGMAENYHTKELHALMEDAENEVLELDIPLKPIDPCEGDLGCKLDLQPIYFDFDKWNIRPDAEVELSKILEAMKLYPELVIHIESHTDSRGTETYNMQLSEKRAQSTRDWLIDKGINADRLTAQGYGESQLVNHCSDGVECTDEEHQLNRRSMFLIKD